MTKITNKNQVLHDEVMSGFEDLFPTSNNFLTISLIYMVYDSDT